MSTVSFQSIGELWQKPYSRVRRVTEESHARSYHKAYSLVPPHSHIPPCSFYFSTGPNRINVRRIRTCYHASARTFIAIKILSAAKTRQHKKPMPTAFRVSL
jgi:hypothetical protein